MAVKKVNGYVQQDTWFEKDTCIMNVVATGGTPFDMPVSVRQGDLSSGGTAEAVMNILQTRGTVIGYTVVSDTEANYMFGHASGYFANDPQLTAPPSPPGKAQPNVLDELKAQLDLLPGVTFDLTVFKGFAGANRVGESYRVAEGPADETTQSPFPTPADDVPATST